MLIIAGHVFLDPSHVEEFVADARATMAAGLTEPGCEFLSFTLDDATQGSVLVLEKWRDQAALDDHLAVPQGVSVFTKWASSMRVETRKYDATGERAPWEVLGPPR